MGILEGLPHEGRVPKIMPRSAISIILADMSNESDSKTYEERVWQYFLQLQPTITDVNAAAEMAIQAVDAFKRGLQRKRARES
jgi:hypothetical protein